MKKISVVILLIFALLLQPISAENPIKVLLDGKAIVFDTPPVVQNGTTLVPLRAIFEALGASVTWDGATQSVTSTLDATTVKLTINSKVAYKNGAQMTLLAPPAMINGRTLVPVRFISESFGLNVSWDSVASTVVIKSSASDWVIKTITKLGFSAHQTIVVDGGNLSGSRKALVKVDVGFGNREYWAFTNANGQLVAVIAETVTLQNESTEPVNKDGRYYNDEAKVPGVESATLDEGHVIADSLGGVSNAYNITPQDSILNQHGNQAYMEKVIRDAGGCSQFVAIITYPNVTTQIPSHYSYTYMLKGNLINDEFDNKNPEATQPTTTIPATTSAPVVAKASSVIISNLDKSAEYVIISNNGSTDADISNWRIVSEVGSQSFTFPAGTILKAGASLKLTSGNIAGTGDYTMAKSNIWNNTTTDPAVLYDASGVEKSRLSK